MVHPTHILVQPRVHRAHRLKNAEPHLNKLKQLMKNRNLILLLSSNNFLQEILKRLDSLDSITDEHFPCHTCRNCAVLFQQSTATEIVSVVGLPIALYFARLSILCTIPALQHSQQYVCRASVCVRHNSHGRRGYAHTTHATTLVSFFAELY